MNFADLKTFAKLNRDMKVHDLFGLVHFLERSHEDGKYSESHIELLNSWLLSLEEHEELALRQLAQLRHKISGDMDPKHFVGLMVPFERLFNRGVVDADFLGEQGDRDAAQAKYPLTIVLDNIRSAINVGSIFRTAECLGAKRVFLCGYTATPDNPKVHKSAMGTCDFVEYLYFDHLKDAVQQLKSENTKIYAVETCEGATFLPKANFSHEKGQSLALLMGNERHGLDEQAIAYADEVLHIPMLGRKNSMNVAVSAAIVIYTMTNS